MVYLICSSSIGAKVGETLQFGLKSKIEQGNVISIQIFQMEQLFVILKNTLVMAEPLLNQQELMQLFSHMEKKVSQ